METIKHYYDMKEYIEETATDGLEIYKELFSTIYRNNSDKKVAHDLAIALLPRAMEYYYDLTEEHDI